MYWWLPAVVDLNQIRTVLGSILGRISALCYCPRLSSDWCYFSIAMVMRLLKTMVLPTFLAPHHRIQLPLTSIKSSLFSHWGDGGEEWGICLALWKLDLGRMREWIYKIALLLLLKQTKLNPTKNSWNHTITPYKTGLYSLQQRSWPVFTYTCKFTVGSFCSILLYLWWFFLSVCVSHHLQLWRIHGCTKMDFHIPQTLMGMKVKGPYL